MGKAMDTSSTLVSCLMITPAGERRQKLLRSSIESYLSQTYEHKELVIVVDNLNKEAYRQLLSYLSTLGRSDIRCVFPDRKLSLGALRNVSMDHAAGDLLCQWDDDDLSHPERVKSQLQFLIENRLGAVMLSDNLHIFPQQGICYWERWQKRIGGAPATIMMKKGHGIRYPESGPESQRGEDTNFIARLKSSLKLGLFEAPPFHYLYFFHDNNTWGFIHHRMLARSMAVSKEKLISSREYLINGIKQVAGLQVPSIQFMEREGPVFLWTRSADTISPAKAAPAYRSRKLMILPGDPGMSMVHSPTKSLLTVMETPIAQSLSKMTEFRKLSEYALDLCAGQKSAPSNLSTFRRLLDDTAREGFLISEQELKAIILSHVQEKNARQGPLSSLGALTYNRPEGLKRCLTSFLENSREYGRSPHIVVMDDSDAPSLQLANETCLQSLNRSCPEFNFLYAGVAEKRSYAATLARHSGVDPELLEFALFDPEHLGQKVGANRNALLLQTAGERFLSVDDDVVCRPCAAPGMDDTIEITSQDPTLVHLFTDRETLLAERPSRNCDVLGLHEGILGKQLGSLFQSEPERPITFESLGTRLFAHLEKTAARIRISWTGFYGDSGATYPTYYLWKDKHVGEQLAAGEERYRRLSLSREIFRAPGHLSIGDEGYCGSAALAYDNQSILPPFMPVLRGEDIVFGKILVACFGPSLIGYLPWAILHAPLESRSNSAEDIAQAGHSTSYHQILHSLVDIFPGAEFERDETELLRRLGSHLCDLGKLPVQEFEEILRTRQWIRLTRRIEYLEKQLRYCPLTPAGWRDDIRTHLQVIHNKLTPEGLRQSLLIRECTLHTFEERLALAQRLTRSFGNLLTAWPSLTQAARELKLRGVELARPLKAS